ncbi:MAG: hypothetical protein IMX03_00715 [Brockia lithotrophica]|nr:hypothetical protein [Brockia lithotrophica]
MAALLFGAVLPVGRPRAKGRSLWPQVSDFGGVPADEDVAPRALVWGLGT